MTNPSLPRRRLARAVPLLTAALLAVGPAVAFAQKYGVTVQVSKAPELTKAKTYTWTRGHPANVKKVDEQVLAAVDKELAALGLTKAASGSGDVLVTYHSLSRLDADLKAKTSDGLPPMQNVGVLVVELLAPADRTPLFRVRADKPIEASADKLEPAINDAVAAIFQMWPTRTAK
jgi:hypothetical protein